MYGRFANAASGTRHGFVGSGLGTAPEVPISSDSRAFHGDAETVRDARDFVRERLFDTSVDLDSAVLLTSELASNAVIHAHTDYRVTIQRHVGAVRVELHNDAPEFLPNLDEPTDTGGRGLHLVDAISSRWGTESSPEHKVVWFELPDPS